MLDASSILLDYYGGRLTPEATAARVVRVDIQDLHPTAYHRRITASIEKDAYRFEVVVTPNEADIISHHFSWVQLRDFAPQLGRLRYATIHDVLRKVEQIAERTLAAKRFGERLYVYQPHGRWEWIAPEHPYDWRTRARTTFAKPTHDHPLLTDIVIAYFTTGADCRSEPLDVRITTQP